MTTSTASGSVPLRSSPDIPPQDEFAGLISTNRAAREEILHRAHAIWELEGRPENRKLDNWLQAESEFRTRAANSPFSPTAPVA